MINVTKEQIKEVLERLRDYGYWMYNSPKSVESFDKQVREVDNKKISISLTVEGYYKLTLLEDPNIYAICQTFIVNAPVRPNTVDNIDFKCHILNWESLSKENQAFFHKAAIIALSATQRACAFQFMARMHDISIEEISEGLSKAYIPV